MKEFNDLLAALEAWESTTSEYIRHVDGKLIEAYRAIKDKEFLMLPQLSTQQLLEAFPCKKCAGTGYLDDAEPGDIYSNQWRCEDCKGAGYRLPTDGGDE